MAEPIYPRGYIQPIEDVFSGNVAGEPRGLLPNTAPIADFFYRHSINRFATGGSATQQGFWTIQIVDSLTAAEPHIFFEQSVMVGWQNAIIVFFPISLFDNYFKTRICNSEFVPPVIEATAPQAEAGNAPLPGNPGVVNLFDVRLTTMQAKIPPLPARANSMTLFWAPYVAGGTPLNGAFRPLRTGLLGGEAVTVDAAGLGLTSENNYIAPTELLWLRLQASGPGGTTWGAGLRDAWNQQVGTQQTAGYQGYLYADKQFELNPTVYYEQSYEINVSNSSSNFLTEDWISPFYRCAIPPGAFLRIISDYWVGTLSDNDIYYALSWRPGGSDLDLLRDANGEMWLFYADSKGALRCAHSRQLKPFVHSDSDAVISANASGHWGAVRVGAWLLVCSDVNPDVQVSMSTDTGNSWQVLMLNLTGLALLSKPQGSLHNGPIFVLCRATADDTANGIHKGDTVGVVLHRNADPAQPFQVQRKQTAVTPTALPASLTTFGLALSGTSLYVASDDGTNSRLWRSGDELATLQEITATG